MTTRHEPRGYGSLSPQPHRERAEIGSVTGESAVFACATSGVLRAGPSKKKGTRYTRPRQAPQPRTSRLEEILETVLRYRVLDRETLQLRHFTPGGRTSTQRALTQLWRSRYLDKLANRALNQRDVYFLSRRAPRGLEALEGLLGGELAPSRLKRPPAINHALAINNFRARIEVSAPEHGLQVDDWRDELDLASLASNGIVPDAFFQIRRRDSGAERRAGFFVEAELAPVSRRHWARRLSHYATFYYSRQYEAAFSLRSLRVLVITSGGGRQPLSIMEEAEQLQFTPVRVTTWEAVRNTSAQALLFAPIWRKPFEAEPGPLYADG